MHKNEKAFLTWLGGYFDHGAYCKAYETSQWITCKGYRYQVRVLHTMLMITGTEDTVTQIRDYFAFQGAAVKKRNHKFVFVIRAKPEMLSFAYQIEPYVTKRKPDVENVIRNIEGWLDEKVSRNIYRGKERAMVDALLDVKARRTIAQR
jgi:hypothetical protein